MDFETFSPAGFVWDATANKWRGPPGAEKKKKGIGVVGAVVYTEHPDADVLSFSYDLKDGRGKRRWRPGSTPPMDLFHHLACGGPIEAWNAAFERWVWKNICVPRYGWPELPFAQVRCAMGKARAWALPGGLGMAGEVLGIQAAKDKDGTRLLDKFSVPRTPTKADPRTRIRPEDDPEDAERLYAYNDRDIEAEAEASRMIPDLNPREFRVWQDDQRINTRGVSIDLPTVDACIAIIRQAQARYEGELRALAGCKPSELAQLRGWLAAQCVYMDAMDEDAIALTLARTDLPAPARRALEVRATVGSASVKKVFAMRNQASAAGRLHDLYSYHGARTGRPTGNGPQPTNLPKGTVMVHRCGYHQGKPLAGGGCGRWHGAHTMWCHWCGKFTVRGPKDAAEWNPDAMADAIESIHHRSLDWLQVLWGDAMATLAGVLRGLFIPSPGHDFLSSDFTAIEGVVIACLAGEQWRIDAFRDDAPMYLLSAERMFGVTVAEMKQYAKDNGHHHPLRQKGKGGELGLGFGGWVNALRQFGVDGTDDELKDTTIKWREASPALVEFWGGQMGGPGRDRWAPRMFGLEGAAIQAVCSPGQRFHVRRLDERLSGISYHCHNDVLYCDLPTGRAITYHRPRVQQAAETWRGLALSFEGYNTNPKSGPPGWIRMNTYSGKLAENVTQAVARDKQMAAITACEDRPEYPVVMHTYDEIVTETPEGAGSVEELESLMVAPQHWNEGWPIKAAGGWRAKRYRKG